MDKETALQALRSEVEDCRACTLGFQRNQSVVGEGSPEARMVLIGEGPGAEEDRIGRPFVGAAGQLLDNMLRAMGMDRFHHVYIANVVKCRPPGNCVPLPEEQIACRVYLNRQLDILDPAIVVLLGGTALQAIMGADRRITRARGQWIEHEGRWWMPTYHPAALLRRPEWKRDTWSDLKQVIDKYRLLVNPQHESPHYPRPG